jgi:hypothetical protein
MATTTTDNQSQWQGGNYETAEKESPQWNAEIHISNAACYVGVSAIGQKPELLRAYTDDPFVLDPNRTHIVKQ